MQSNQERTLTDGQVNQYSRRLPDNGEDADQNRSDAYMADLNTKELEANDAIEMISSPLNSNLRSDKEVSDFRNFYQ